jgi:hypothetical protein
MGRYTQTLELLADISSAKEVDFEKISMPTFF